MKQKKLIGISSRNWEHPTDKMALVALKKITGLDELVRRVIGATTEKSLRLMHLASAVKVTDTQFHRVHYALRTACEILDSPKVPDVFVAQSPFFNASVLGADNPFIVIQSSTLEGLSEEELLCVVGHELGHVLSGHALYKTLLWLLLNISFRLIQIPLANIVIIPIILALKEWDRKSELSADRASLLVTQNEISNFLLLMKMTGGSFVGEMNINDFFLQAAEYENDTGALESLYKLLNTLNTSHPFSVIRLKELKTWSASGQYERIVNGDYVKRGSEEESLRESINDAKTHYGESFQKGKSQVGDALGSLREGADKVVEGIGKIFDDIFKKP
jgi:Zn-dependent protease with chaperone function